MLRLFITAPLLLVLASCEKQESKTGVLTPDTSISGELLDRRYLNDHFGVEFGIPESWELESDSHQIQAEMKQNAKSRAPGTEAQRGAVRPWIEHLFKASRKADEVPGRSWLQINAAVHHHGAGAGQESSRAYAEKYLRDISGGMARIKMVDLARPTSLNGVEFIRIRYGAQAGTMSIYQSAYFRVVEKDVLIIIGYHATDEHLQVLADFLQERDAGLVGKVSMAK